MTAAGLPVEVLVLLVVVLAVPERMARLRGLVVLTAGTLLAADRPAEARDVLLAAEGLWRGPALVEYRDREFAQGLVARLEDRRIAAIEDRIRAELALGRHAAVVGELAELVNAHPLQEGFRGLLALALYRSGRQAEALEVYHRAREVLDRELGVDPGRELESLQRAVLDHDSALDLAAVPGPVPVDDLVSEQATRPIPSVPRPRDTRRTVTTLNCFPINTAGTSSPMLVAMCV